VEFATTRSMLAAPILTEGDELAISEFDPDR
jgi:hypothetical protein